MPDVTKELIYEGLKAFQARLEQVHGKVDELKQEMQSFRTPTIGVGREVIGVHQELSGIHATLIRHEQPLDRIERRLEIVEVG